MSKLELAVINLNADISVLRHYVDISKEVGMTNMLDLLECMCIPLFHISHGYNLVNKKLFAPNFPAIDLSDDAQGVAIQVTAKADAKKVRKTLKQYEKLNTERLKAQPKQAPYTKLIIFSVLKTNTVVKIPPGCELMSFAEVITAAKSQHNEAKIQQIINTIRQHNDYSRLHPYADANCLEIILGCVDRNAVKHRMHQEGSHDAMIKGLNEITELISKGSINGEPQSKDVERFDDPAIKKHLRDIRHQVGKIVSIANEACNGQSSGFIPPTEFNKINNIKAKIIKIANAAAEHSGIDITLSEI